jgi:benzoyl-CoA reductase subunit B
VNSVKSCNSFSSGQLLIMREVEKRAPACAAGFVETDLVDPRYFSAANIKNRIESYLQMIEQRRRGVHASAPPVAPAPIGARRGLRMKTSWASIWAPPPPRP